MTNLFVVLILLNVIGNRINEQGMITTGLRSERRGSAEAIVR